MRPPLNLDFQWLSVPLLVAHMISIVLFFFKWYDKMTKIILSCFRQYRDHGRACLLMLIKLIGVYPTCKRVGMELMENLEPLTSQEELKDVQAMAKRCHTLLGHHNSTLHDNA